MHETSVAEKINDYKFKLFSIYSNHRVKRNSVSFSINQYSLNGGLLIPRG